MCMFACACVYACLRVSECVFTELRNRERKQAREGVSST